MDVSFILATDEIFTLMSLLPGHTEDGKRFTSEALHNAKACDLSGLAAKKLAKATNGKLELAPGIRMIIDGIARADSAVKHGAIWEIRSPWVFLRCEKYPYQEDCWKITPVEDNESRIMDHEP